MIPRLLVWIIITAPLAGLYYSKPLFAVYAILSQLAFWSAKWHRLVGYLTVVLAIIGLLILLYPQLSWLRWLWPVLNSLVLLMMAQSLIGLVKHEKE